MAPVVWGQGVEESWVSLLGGTALLGTKEDGVGMGWVDQPSAHVLFTGQGCR